MALTYFVASLRCPRCGRLTADTTSTEMVNHLAEEPYTVYRVGDDVPDTDEELTLAFIPASPRKGSEARILHCWTCPFEGTLEWAEVVLDGGRVREIQAVDLTPEVVRRANYASEFMQESYYGITDEGLTADGEPHDWPERLARALEQQRS